MLSKLSCVLFPSVPIHILFCFSRRSISQNVIRLNKLNSQLVNKQDKASQPVTITKTIDARPVLPDKATQTLEYLQSLSAKNAFLARIVRVPINIIVWNQLQKQKKIDSSVRFIGSFLVIIIIFIFVNAGQLYDCYNEHEITKRGYFLVHRPELLKKLDEAILNETLHNYVDKFIDSSNPLVKNLDQVLQKLIESNKDFVEDENFDLNWACTVIDDTEKFDLIVNDEMKFVTTTKAVVQICQNEHQLAYLVANALAHFLLKHKREPLSNIKPYNIWKGYQLAYFPYFFKIFDNANYFGDLNYINMLDKIDHLIGKFFYRQYRKLVDVMCYSDTLEEEADRIALQLLARACFDVREVEKVAAAFRKLIPVSETEKPAKELLFKYRYIYKHAYNDHKMSYIHDNLYKFVDFRQKCGCTPLK